MSIGKVCSRVVHTGECEETVQAVAVRMKRHNIGTIVVVAAHKPVGILTDRDLVVRVMAEKRAPGATRVDEVMTHHPRLLSEDMAIEDALSNMRQIGVRRAPVVDARGDLVGLLSLDDVLELITGELGDVGRVIAQSTKGAALPVKRTPQPRPLRATVEGSGA